MYQGKIIDTHMHLWDIKNGYDWLPKLANGILHSNFLMNDYRLMAQHQPILAMVHIECGGFPQNPVLETKWVQEQADQYGGPQAIIGFAKLDDPNVENTLKEHLNYPNFRGIRMPLNYVEGCFGADREDYMKNDQWQKGFTLLSKYQLLFEMQIFDTQLTDATHLAKQYPDNLIILEHLGWPKESTIDHLPKWEEHLKEIAQYKNVFLKLSCLGWIFQTNDREAVQAYLKKALQIFGSDRCMIGSNCPPDKVFISFDQIFDHFREALASYSQDDQEKVFYKNAATIYRINNLISN